MTTALGLLAVAALIAANGYFVAAEFAFVAARRSEFAARADEGDRRSRRAIEVQRRLSFMLSGAQLGITVTSLAVGFIAEPAVASVIRPGLERVGVPESAVFGVSLTIAFVLATVTQMVFGELAPKNLAIAKPEAVGRALAPSTLLFMKVAGPIIRLFDSSSNRLLRLLGIDPVQELHGAVSAEELDLIVDTSAESGHLSARQAALLDRAIDFAELEASDAMVPWNRVVTIEADATAADLRDLMATSHSRFPVLDEDDAVVGVVHAKDLLGVDPDRLAETPVRSLAHEVLVVPEAAGLRIVLGQLREHATEMAVVVDEYGGPAGVVTLEDVVEELVGDIADEYDLPDIHQPREIEPGVWRLPADWRVDEIERVTGYALPEGDYDTVAGLVLDRMERIPDEGDIVDVDGVRIEVTRRDEWAIGEIVICVVPIEPDEPVDDDDGDGQVAADDEPNGAGPAADDGTNGR